MKKALMFKIAAISTMLITILAIAPVVAMHDDTKYIFTVMGVTQAANTIPNTHVKAGDRMCFFGGGTFDTSTGAVSGGGVMAHINFDGTLHNVGTWKVKEFVSFVSYGLHRREQGGLLTVIIEIAPRGEATSIGKLIVSNPVKAPVGTQAEGFTLWGGPNYAIPVFGIVVSGHTSFYQCQSKK